MSTRLKELRIKMNLNQQEFSEKLGISRADYSRMESGSVAITDKIINLICSTYKINKDWLVNGTGECYLSEIRPNENDMLLKYQIMLQMLNTKISETNGIQLENLVNSFSYFVSILLSDKNLESPKNNDYINTISQFFDVFEKFIFFVSHNKVKKGITSDKPDFEMLYELSQQEKMIQKEFEKNISSLLSIFNENI